MSIDRRAGERLRALVLCINFALVILAYYQVKPASRSLFLEFYTAAQLPYVWLASAAVLAVLMPPYARAVERFSRPAIVVGSCVLFAALLLFFRAWNAGPLAAVAFYVVVDILSVVLVEQFWSLANSAFASQAGRRWYGLIGAGGLLGGLLGGQLAAYLVSSTPLQTLDLLLVAAALLGVIAALSVASARAGLFREMKPAAPARPVAGFGLGNLFSSRYLALIAGTLFLAQLAEPIVEYQFMAYVQEAWPQREERTAYLSSFLATLGGVALAVNLLLTPLVLRWGGALAGMALQPLALLVSSASFAAAPGLMSGAIMKIADRGLSYSINRASKELLYVPLPPELIYTFKAWIDMFGYRAFKTVGALLILSLTEWSGLLREPVYYSWIVVPLALAWLVLIMALREPYRARLRDEPA